MFKEKFILQEEIFSDNYSASTGYVDGLASIANERYNELLDIHQQADEEDVTFNVSSKSGQYHHSFETNIIFHNELENIIIQNKYPKVKFSEIHATVSRAWNGQYREKTGKKFSYRVSGQREDLANYFWLEKNECKDTFYRLNPTNLEKAKMKVSKTINVYCDKTKAKYLRSYLSNASKHYVNLSANINEQKSITEKKIGVKLFNKQCLFNIKVSGN